MKVKNLKYTFKKFEKFLRLIWIVSVVISGLGILLLCFASDGFTGLVLLSITLFFGVIMFTIQSLDGKYIDLIPKPIAEKIKIKYNNFQEIILQIDKNCKFEKTSIKINDDMYGIAYYESKRHWYNFFGKELKFIFAVNIKEYSNENLDLIIKKFEESIVDYVGNFTKDDYVEFTLIICMENLNQKFEKYINDDIIQQSTRIKLPVGIVFSDNTMYISTQKSIMFKKRYEKLKNNILDILSN